MQRFLHSPIYCLLERKRFGFHVVYGSASSRNTDIRDIILGSFHLPGNRVHKALAIFVASDSQVHLINLYNYCTAFSVLLFNSCAVDAVHDYMLCTVSWRKLGFYTHNSGSDPAGRWL